MGDSMYEKELAHCWKVALKITVPAAVLAGCGLFLRGPYEVQLLFWSGVFLAGLIGVANTFVACVLTVRALVSFMRGAWRQVTQEVEILEVPFAILEGAHKPLRVEPIVSSECAAQKEAA